MQTDRSSDHKAERRSAQRHHAPWLKKHPLGKSGSHRHPAPSEEQKAMERRAGLTLCFAGGICFVLLLALFVLPEAGQQLRLSSSEVEGAELLFLVSVLSIVTGLIVVIRNQ